MTDHQAGQSNAEPSHEDQAIPAGTGAGLVILLLAALLSGGLAGIVGTALRRRQPGRDP